MVNKHKQYTKEFKEEAVRLAISGGRTRSEVAESLGIYPSLVTRWIQEQEREGREAFRGQGKRTALEEELWRLKIENKRLQQEMEFLKKVSRYFAKEPK